MLRTFLVAMLLAGVAGAVESLPPVAAPPPGPFGGGRISINAPGLKELVVPPVAEATPAEEAALVAVRSGDESYAALLRAAIVASGVSEPKAVARDEALAAKELAALRQIISPEKDPARVGDLLLRAMHKTVLKAYA